MNDETTPARLSTVALFPRHYFLESIAVRGDGSMLVNAVIQKELWYVPAPGPGATVEPALLHTFDQLAMGIVEAEPDVFYMPTSNGYTTHESYLHRLDLRGWGPGMAVHPEVVLEFPAPVRAPNGACMVAPRTLLMADGFAGLIWRIDLSPDGGTALARVWLRHENMAHDPGGPMPDQPGVNGVQFAPETGHLYYTSTAQRLFMRVRVDPGTLAPAGEPEFVAGGMMGDDFCIDEAAGVAYVATHRQNTIDRVSLEPGENGIARRSVAGDPFTERLVGPTKGVWGRAPGDHGRVAYFTTDGGEKSPPPDRIVRPAAVLRVEF